MAVAQLFEAYAASLPVALDYQDFDTELATLPGKYAPPRGALLVAVDANDHPCGCIALRPLDTKKVCELKRLYVAPVSRGGNLGRALVTAALAEAARLGYREAWLDTLPSMTQAIALYERMGFCRIAPYYDTPVLGTVFLGRAIDL